MSTEVQRIEVSMDGVHWTRAYLRPATESLSPPDARLLPEGHRWIAVQVPGRPVRWEPLVDEAAC